MFGVVHVNSVKGRWDQKWNRSVRWVPSKVLMLQETEALKRYVLSHDFVIRCVWPLCGGFKSEVMIEVMHDQFALLLW
ncbi:hypothetical protein MIZ03_1652 [Rhodoferax lithotrophicus]|uniref:Uncharacterized protein n=1 Tax=Rhodoferax lithotrophicus TaxID=2798804 RepID=A0ABM7MKQ9_9BURK|nr:hypothetical protein MIZ03_1652 [Rhodoferax sp. MIZ03]